MTRKRRPKKIRTEVMIFCEGETELNYFKMLQQKYNGSGIKLKLRNENGQKGNKLVNEAIVWRNAQGNGFSGSIYVCFDDDSQDKDSLVTALQTANHHHINVIFSKINVEVWLLRHFRPIETTEKWLEKTWLYQRLTETLQLKKRYESYKGQDIAYKYEDYVQDAATNCAAFFGETALDSSVFYTNRPFTNFNHSIRDIFSIDTL
ncbi:hypothetical protein AYR62_03175 [Secundilactobacillus paracollinoides]|uniref:RloB-like protein n=1 Tax=Secundilactobacillus paracollinoides TaxID=240427 RepID=A0A1B2J1Z0_9LACO|nr:RloB family protein [Secundilactobacillus paracollinoides]ANZ62370.1 hypothetical protein AYR61_14200 [Secundilactobacillus paracollinoides]ANZ63197.1 hypothetical protein AYR62_03175 [Secundilactobacillus paracollinoides]ANZ68321.1 hypothetical protein AYR63_15100 [Secundilactobacillus paracollinoides]